MSRDQPGARRRILIVDDHPINVVILEELFDSEFDLAVATSGEEALEVAGLVAPDLILLDVMMPGMDGYEVCRRIRADPDLAATKVVMVTARAMEAERRQGYEAGADDYVTKPFDPMDLLERVRTHFCQALAVPGQKGEFGTITS